MRRQSLILGIVLVVLVLAFYVYNYPFNFEGFETIDDMIQDRGNPMAAAQNPLTNPAAAIGISEAEGAALRSMTQVALNMPNASADGAGSYTQEMPNNTISPRIDNENSYLGLITMCKEKGKGETPFSDSEFNENCGMCITSGTLKTGESFTGPTGVLVYKADKDAAIAKAAENRYPFARAVPSIDSATCLGANKDNNSLPVLAINQADYNAFRKRHDCRNNKKIGGECGRCLSDQESTWVPPSGGKQALKLYLWGSGNAKVSLANGFVKENIKLSDSTNIVSMGPVEEETGIEISVTSNDVPYIYGAIVSATANNGIYKLQIERFLEKDTVSGSAPRRGLPKYFEDASISCAKLTGQPNNNRMNLTGFIPITLVEADQLAAFDCPSKPLVKSQASADLLINDVCSNPRGQGPGKYSDECIRQKILDGGCSTNGTWYQNPPTNTVMDLGIYLNYIRTQLGLVKSDPIAAMGCKGIDIRTPCDSFLNGGIPDKACMKFLYLNESENTRVGRAYTYASAKNATTINNKIAFCRPEGSLNPDNVGGMSELVGIARGDGKNGLSGIEAVKKYLSDVFTRAYGNFDVNVDDTKGGRKTSWNKCIGINIADPPLRTVSLNSMNEVITQAPNCFPFPPNINLPTVTGSAKKIGEINLTQNYTLSFKITPVISSEWKNGYWKSIIHFTTTNTDWNSLGCRCPAIWFYPATLQLHVRIGDTNDFNWGVDTVSAIPQGQKSTFRLECRGKDVTLTVNNEVIKVKQPDKRPMGKAIVYAPNPWYMAANASIENLCYTAEN